MVCCVVEAAKSLTGQWGSKTTTNEKAATPKHFSLSSFSSCFHGKRSRAKKKKQARLVRRSLFPQFFFFAWLWKLPLPNDTHILLVPISHTTTLASSFDTLLGVVLTHKRSKRGFQFVTHGPRASRSMTSFLSHFLPSPYAIPSSAVVAKYAVESVRIGILVKFTA